MLGWWGSHSLTSFTFFFLQFDNNCVKLARTTKFNIQFHQAPKKRNSSSKLNQNDTTHGQPPKTYLNCDGNPIKVHSSDFSIRYIFKFIYNITAFA